MPLCMKANSCLFNIVGTHPVPPGERPHMAHSPAPVLVVTGGLAALLLLSGCAQSGTSGASEASPAHSVASSTAAPLDQEASAAVGASTAPPAPAAGAPEEGATAFRADDQDAVEAAPSTGSVAETGGGSGEPSEESSTSGGGARAGSAQARGNTSVSQDSAARKVQDYVALMGFSREGLIDQLGYEGFSPEEAAAAVDQAGIDYNAQAAKKAEDYVSLMGFSQQGLIEQLEFDGFTPEQAAHGATGNGL